MKNMTILKAFTGTLFVSVLVVGGFAAAPFYAHAQYEGSTDFGGDAGASCCGDVSYIPDTSTNYYPDTSTTYYPDTSTNYYPDTTTNYYPDTTSSYYPDTYSSSYLPVSSYGGSWGYSSGGYSGGGWSIPSGTSNANSNTNIIDNGNSCTATNSCNTNIVTNTTNSIPVVYNNPPVVYTPPPVYYTNPTPVCNTCGCLGYPVCAPLAYNATPYISLSQTPYTGLDLGFWGTIAYWSFLVLWCLAAAYLIVVKRVQNRIFNSMKNFLFGSAASASASLTLEDSAFASAPAASAPQATKFTQADLTALAGMLRSGFEAPKVAYSAPVSHIDATDSFVLSQVNRSRKV